MEEQLITFEIAKLAKEKGFNIPLSMVYHIPSKTLAVAFSSISNDEKDNHHCTAPTQSLLQRWLREEHKLHITVFSSSQESWMFRITKPHQKLKDGVYGEDYETYEQALEKGLQEALKIIN